MSTRRNWMRLMLGFNFSRLDQVAAKAAFIFLTGDDCVLARVLLPRDVVWERDGYNFRMVTKVLEQIRTVFLTQFASCHHIMTLRLTCYWGQ